MTRSNNLFLRYSSMAKSSQKQRLSTPVRKRFLDIFKPSKVNKTGSNGQTAADIFTDAHMDSSPAPAFARSPSVALQNEDGDVHGTIIISTLDSIPFCCHEDLLTMDSQQLHATTQALNAKLPCALRINLNPSLTDAFIRNAIELIVGIKRTVPPAPKAIKSGLTASAETEKSDVSPPTSPLARKGRPGGMRMLPRRLESLAEEDTITMAEDRVKRRLSIQEDVANKRRRLPPRASAPVRRTKSARVSTRKPGPNPSRRVPTSQISPPRSSRVLRSHSQKLPREMRQMNIDTAFVTIQRPRYRFQQNYIDNLSVHTPGRAVSDTFGGPRPRDMSTSESEASNTSPPLSPVIAHSTRGYRNGKAEQNSGGSDADVEGEDGDMTFGLRDMTMAASTAESHL